MDVAIKSGLLDIGSSVAKILFKHMLLLAVNITKQISRFSYTVLSNLVFIFLSTKGLCGQMREQTVLQIYTNTRKRESYSNGKVSLQKIDDLVSRSRGLYVPGVNLWHVDASLKSIVWEQEENNQPNKRTNKQKTCWGKGEQITRQCCAGEELRCHSQLGEEL